MLYQENDGLLRWFVLGGVALGMLFENGVISPFVIHLAVKVLRFWQRIFGRIFGAAKKPGRKVFLFLKKELQKIRKAIKIGISKQ